MDTDLDLEFDFENNSFIQDNYYVLNIAINMYKYIHKTDKINLEPINTILIDKYNLIYELNYNIFKIKYSFNVICDYVLYPPYRMIKKINYPEYIKCIEIDILNTTYKYSIENEKLYPYDSNFLLLEFIPELKINYFCDIIKFKKEYSIMFYKALNKPYLYYYHNYTPYNYNNYLYSFFKYYNLKKFYKCKFIKNYIYINYKFKHNYDLNRDKKKFILNYKLLKLI